MLIEALILDPSKSAVCIREYQRTLQQSVKLLLEQKIAALNVGDHFIVQDAVIKTRGKGKIIFQGMQTHNADSIKSLEGFDLAWCEESQALSERSLNILRPTIRKPNSELWFTWNPRYPTDPIDRFLRSDDRPEDSIVVEVNYDQNPHFPEVLQKEMEYDRAHDPAKYAHVWLGQYVQNTEAQVFKNWRIEEFETPENAIHRLGVDWGYAHDPTVMVRCHIIGKKLFVDYEAWQIGCEIVDTPALFFTIPESNLWPCFADSARPETISHVRKNGFPKMYPAIKGPRSVEEGVEWLKSFEIIVHPRCEHVAQELLLYSFKIDPLTEKVLPVLADKHNHTIDSLRYACEGARRAEQGKQRPKQYEAPPRVANRWS